MRIILDQNDFEKITRGEVIKKESVEIALSDIGFYMMDEIVQKNWIESDEYKEMIKNYNHIDSDHLYSYDPKYNRNL